MLFQFLKKGKIAYFVLLIFMLSFSMVVALFYGYDQKITITDSDGSYMGYAEPYRMSTVLGSYSYFKWQREGFPEGNSWPVYLVEGTTTALPFGIEGEVLRVKINSVTGSGVDLIIDKSDILTEINSIPETLPGNVNAIANETAKQNDASLEEVNRGIGDLTPRVEKAVNRGYHSSLHVLGSSASTVEKSVSQSVMSEEVKFARKVSDRVTSLLIDAFIGDVSFQGLTYSQIVALIPSSVRNDLTQFFYNIDSITDYGKSQDSLASDSSFTLYFGNPGSNKISASFNERLKSLGLPYFLKTDGKWQIIGKRTYNEDSIGIVAAIPEETVWTDSTLENRWNNSKIRLYETLIAGTGDEGIEAAGQWYNDMLAQSGDLMTSFSSLAEEGFSTDDVFKVISDNVKTNPKSSISGFTILQGLLLSGVETLQNPDFKKADSLGYVVIVKKEGSSYRILEMHTLNGQNTNYFLEPYDSPEEVVGSIQEIKEAVQEIEPKITGKVVKQAPVQKEVNQQEETEQKAGLFKKIGNWFKNIWRRWFG